MNWLPIETAPKDGTDIIVGHLCNGCTWIVNAAFWINGPEDYDDSPQGWWSYTRSEVSRELLDDWQTPTHWIPLPELE